ncbi:hypothetical protein TraAM80_06936 [Trypanosoma rangeli]|uniref:Uncharacterized protein n=1 Tax=Trypanosoma rangeli TaxID=5698 RepID=A0A3R7MFM5_TRYRA|nr:uncharacterized protein TraAM80_06936 [Trypanosoma rangeli]RNF01622.1 hypothetical protein TraAM80_06936 [Trypanosoma rangeli]|eukprot:RNF01622.1 hypothetical protein TraAM80_06936 [Trypanosoma rangeli]
MPCHLMVACSLPVSVRVAVVGGCWRGVTFFVWVRAESPMRVDLVGCRLFVFFRCTLCYLYFPFSPFFSFLLCPAASQPRSLTSATLQPLTPQRMTMATVRRRAVLGPGGPCAAAAGAQQLLRVRGCFCSF